MARGDIIGIGIFFLIIAIIGYNVPISVTLADTTVNLTIPQVVAFCESGFGQISQMLAQVVMICSEYNNFMMGIYGSGLLGIILIIVGLVTGKKEEDESEQVDTSIEILKERYAKGEISKEEFEKMKDDLEN